MTKEYFAKYQISRSNGGARRPTGIILNIRKTFLGGDWLIETMLHDSKVDTFTCPIE